MMAATILIVDDDEGHLMVAQRAIARSALDVDVRIAHSGQEALGVLGLDDETAWTSACDPVLIMLDLSMPGISGWDVLRRIRAEHLNVPVVVTSSSGRPEDIRRSYELGANSYVVKRYEAQRPGGYLADAARYWIELNTPAERSHAT